MVHLSPWRLELPVPISQFQIPAKRRHHRATSQSEATFPFAHSIPSHPIPTAMQQSTYIQVDPRSGSPTRAKSLCIPRGSVVHPPCQGPTVACPCPGFRIPRDLLGTPQRWACKEIGYRIAGCFPLRENVAGSLGGLLFLYGSDMRCCADGKES